MFNSFAKATKDVESIPPERLKAIGTSDLNLNFKNFINKSLAISIFSFKEKLFLSKFGDQYFLNFNLKLVSIEKELDALNT